MRDGLRDLFRDGAMLMLPLVEDYYAECHEIFRSATNQTDLMLNEVREYSLYRERVSILSVGSGSGLFEIPMLWLILEAGTEIKRFVGIDINAYSCDLFKRKLQGEFGSMFAFEVINLSFQEFQTEGLFDIVLFNHTFEYLGEHHLHWIRKSMSLSADEGYVLIFSPNRGGINRVYAELTQDLNGFAPFFSDDIERMLISHSINYSTKAILAECDISLLDEPNENPEKVKLLSFLTQMDCRTIPDKRINMYTEYYKSLRFKDQNHIPHPATLFIL